MVGELKDWIFIIEFIAPKETDLSEEQAKFTDKFCFCKIKIGWYLKERPHSKIRGPGLDEFLAWPLDRSR